MIKVKGENQQIHICKVYAIRLKKIDFIFTFSYSEYRRTQGNCGGSSPPKFVLINDSGRTNVH